MLIAIMHPVSTGPERHHFTCEPAAFQHVSPAAEKSENTTALSASDSVDCMELRDIYA
ncbi:MAG: hypothetical protein JXQ27_11250 [Acidobacteria bacterium]|nr:hypothetical protein [Acidobacteriota bacterium]